MRGAAGLRALPIAVLAAMVVSAVVARIGRPPPTFQSAGSAAVVSGSAVASFMPGGPSPPPSADVTRGAARTLHGSGTRVHRAAAHGPKTPKIAFRIVVDEGAPIAAQVVTSPDEGTLYVATLGGHLVALARADGKRQWSIALGDRAYSTPLVTSDGRIVVGSDAKKLFAIAPSGESVFRLEVEGEADSGPLLAESGDVVFAAGRFVHAVRRGGDLAWRFAAKGKVFTSPARTEGGLVVFGSQDHHVYALGGGGALAWATDLGADVDGGPAVDGASAIYVGTDGGEVVRLDEKGAVVWRTAVGGFVRGTLSVARNGDVLAGTYGPAPRLVRIAPDGVVRGAFPIAGTGAREFGIHGGPLEDADGALYFGAQDDAAYALEPDGRLRWRFPTGGDVDAPLTLLSDGSLVVPSEDGTVTLLMP